MILTSDNTAFDSSTGTFTRTLQVGKRQFKGQWTLEAAKDMKVLHGIDIEKEIVDLMKREIAREMTGIYKEVYGRDDFQFDS